MIRDAIKYIAEVIISEKNHLTNLDTKIGDGDHGLNMARGAEAVIEAVDELDDNSLDISTAMKTVGQSFLMNVGGASGPLYGTGFMEASKVLSKDSKLETKTIIEALEAAIAGIKRRGYAEKGDKTMLDTLIPIKTTLELSLSEGKNLGESLETAIAAAKEGVEYTKTIAAKRGRASYIGERSIGYEDPGAVSSFIIFRSFYQYLKDNRIV